MLPNAAPEVGLCSFPCLIPGQVTKCCPRGRSCPSLRLTPGLATKLCRRDRGRGLVRKPYRWGVTSVESWMTKKNMSCLLGVPSPPKKVWFRLGVFAGLPQGSVLERGLRGRRAGTDRFQRVRRLPSTRTKAPVSLYHGALAVLQHAVARQYSRVYIYGDSILVIKQLCGVWKCKADDLAPYYENGLELMRQLRQNCTSGIAAISHVYREYNADAASLTNIAIDGYNRSNATVTFVDEAWYGGRNPYVFA